jgi:hypothetical protein
MARSTITHTQVWLFHTWGWKYRRKKKYQGRRSVEWVRSRFTSPCVGKAKLKSSVKLICHFPISQRIGLALRTRYVLLSLLLPFDPDQSRRVSTMDKSDVDVIAKLIPQTEAAYYPLRFSHNQSFVSPKPSPLRGEQITSASRETTPAYILEPRRAIVLSYSRTTVRRTPGMGFWELGWEMRRPAWRNAGEKAVDELELAFNK